MVKDALLDAETSVEKGRMKGTLCLFCLVRGGEVGESSDLGTGGNAFQAIINFSGKKEYISEVLE